MPWKTVSILWPVLVAALLPLDIEGISARLPMLLSRLAAMEGKDRGPPDRSRPRQVNDFRAQFSNKIRRASRG
jgi:hypothetical protein